MSEPQIKQTEWKVTDKNLVSSLFLEFSGKLHSTQVRIPLVKIDFDNETQLERMKYDCTQYAIEALVEAAEKGRKGFQPIRKTVGGFLD